MRFMTLVKSKEQGIAPPQALIDAIMKLGEEAAKAGLLVEMGGLAPTALGFRARLAGEKITVIDGPFSEAKEVIGGFAVYELASKEEAIAWTKRFLDLHITHWKEWEGECEVRQMFGPGDLPPR